MGGTLQQIVDVQVALATAGPQAKGFGTALILGSSNRFSGGTLFQTYTSAAAMLAAGGGPFMNTDPEYVAAASYFAGDPDLPSPTSVMVGYSPADVAQVDTLTPTVQNSTPYSVTLNGQTASITSGGSATAAAIVSALITAIEALSPVVPITPTGTSTLILTAASAGQPFTCSATSNLAISDTTADGGVDTALSNIVAAGGTAWYALILCSRADVDIEQAASWIETNGKTGLYLFEACNQEAGVLTAQAGNIELILQGKSYLRTDHFWSGAQASYPEAALWGAILPQTPGSATAAFKTLSGITPDANSVLTATAVANLTAQNGNYYPSIAGQGCTQVGIQAGGQWRDVIIGMDWITANMQTAVYTVLLNNPKIAFTDAGISMIVNAMRGVLKQAVVNGILAAGTAANGLQFPNGYTIAQPTAASLAAYKASRQLPNIPFQGLLAGAVNSVILNGVLTN